MMSATTGATFPGGLLSPGRCLKNCLQHVKARPKKLCAFPSRSPHGSGCSLIHVVPPSSRHIVTCDASVSVAAKTPMAPGDSLDDDYVYQYPKSVPRRAGILIHPTCLPGSYGIGELGQEAIKFLDWLHTTGCTIWQVLPLVPPGRNSGEDGSPYAGKDANCGNTLLISLEELVKEGLLDEADLPDPVPVKNVVFDDVAVLKDPLISKAAKELVGSKGPLKDQFEAFKEDPVIAAWLFEAALFAAIDNSQKKEFWWLWPEDLRDRHPEALAAAAKEHKEFIEDFMAEQFLFQHQWNAVHEHAKDLGITIIGDMPIYVGGHSADVWANRSQFAMGPDGVPAEVSGVPPDLFSATGQYWGSPLYDWVEMAKDGYKWWANRMRRAFDLYDEFRIDHFRGLAGYWAIPATAKTAVEGTWKAGPREAFFDAIKEAVGKVDIIAEDLGVITADVVDLRRAIDAPGMSVLQFAFGSDPKNPHLPHNHEENQVVYPGTHDNETTVGWWQNMGDKDRENVIKYLGPDVEEIHWVLIKAAAASPARTAIFAMQDLLGLDNSARMNTPAVQKGNWAWRVGDSTIFESISEETQRFTQLLADYNRLPKGFVVARAEDEVPGAEAEDPEAEVDTPEAEADAPVEESVSAPSAI